MFFLEGFHLINLAINANIKPVKIFFSNLNSISKFDALLLNNSLTLGELPIYNVNENLMEKLPSICRSSEIFGKQKIFRIELLYYSSNRINKDKFLDFMHYMQVL